VQEEPININYAGQQIYNNPDLSPQEAKLAYEEQKLRRGNKQLIPFM